jgi:outer membrane protein TolC
LSFWNQIPAPDVFPFVRSSFQTSILFVGATLVSGQAASPEDSFLRQVLARNPSVQVESLSVAASRETRSGAQSLLLPQLELDGLAQASTAPSGSPNGSILQGSAKLTQYLPTGATAEGDLLASRIGRTAAGIHDTLGVGASVTQPLLRGFGEGSSTAYALAQSKSAERIQVLSGKASVLALLSQARDAWWRQYALQAVLAFHVEDTLRTFRLLSAARQNFLSGAGSRLDTLQAQADHLQAKSGLLDAWIQARSGAIDLGGFLDTSETWLDADTSRLPSDSVLSAWPSLDSLARLADSGALDIAQALALEEKARSERIFRQRETLPALDAQVFARHALVPGNSRPADNLGAQATFSWSLPDGVDRASARKAYLDLRKAGIQAEQARRNVRRSLAKLLDQAAQVRLSLDLQRQLLAAKELQLRAAETGHRDGSVSWADLSAARRDWLSASAQVWSTFATAQQTETSIQSLTGTGPARLGWSWGD